MLLFRGRALVFVLIVGLAASVGAADRRVASAQLVEPVAGEVADRFRPPEHFGGPGNRGWEYRTSPGSAVSAAAAGVVAFAGPIGGRLYVSIDHSDGLRTSYSWLASVSVVRGQRVAQGTPLGVSGARFHFGVRRDGAYVDPARLFGERRGSFVRLVPGRFR